MKRNVTQKYERQENETKRMKNGVKCLETY